MSRSADERPTLTSGSGEVESIEVHDLVPSGHEVTHELLLRVVARVDLRDGSELGVRTDDQVDGGSGPLHVARGAIPALVHALGPAGDLPLPAHVEPAQEALVGQRVRPRTRAGRSGQPARRTVRRTVSG